MLRVAIYARVSTHEQVIEGYSINEQIERMTAYCKAKNWIIGKQYIDAGISGKDTNRPALQELLLHITKGLYNAVIVYKLDRLSRNQKDTLILIEDYFLKNNVDFISITENFDTSTPFGRAMVGLLAVFAQLEREQIKERMLIGMEGRIKKGKFHGAGITPIGYEYINGKLIINDFEAMQIREIHRLYQAGNNCSVIADSLNQKGLTHKYGKWSAHRVRAILLNSLYSGYVKSGSLIAPGEHTPIVSEEVFQATIRLHDNKITPRSKTPVSLLTGILYCQKCGARFCYCRVHDFKYYACYSRSKRKKNMIKNENCKNKIWRGDDLDSAVINEIYKLKLEQTSHPKQTEDKEKIIKKQIKHIDNQISRLLDLYGIKQLSLTEIQNKIEPLKTLKDKLENEIIFIRKESENKKDILNLIPQIKDIMQKATLSEKRALIQSLIQKIEIDDDDIYIHWKLTT